MPLCLKTSERKKSKTEQQNKNRAIWDHEIQLQILNGHFDCDPGLLKKGWMVPEDLQDVILQADGWADTSATY